jgi:hypothetical protein
MRFEIRYSASAGDPPNNHFGRNILRSLRMRQVCWAVAIGSATGCVDAPNQGSSHPNEREHAQLHGTRFGMSVATVSDMDGDNLSDVVIGAPSQDGFGTWPGTVVIVSSRTGARIGELTVGADVESFGTRLCNIGDLDGDGVDDLAVLCAGRESELSPEPSGREIHLISTKSNKPLGVIRQRSEPLFAEAMIGHADLDADGIEDLVVSTLDAGIEKAHSGFISAYTLGPRRVLWTSQQPNDVQLYGRRMEWMDDVDGDGVQDLMVNGVRRGGQLGEVGVIDLLSGKTGKHISAIEDPFDCQSFGCSTVVCPDVDADGIRDLIVLGRASADRPGLERLYLFSGASRRLLHCEEFHRDLEEARVAGFGYSMSVVPDEDGDGHPEIAIGSIDPHNLLADGHIDIFNGQSLKLIRRLMSGPGIGLQSPIWIHQQEERESRLVISTDNPDAERLLEGRSSSAHVFSFLNGTKTWDLAPD